MHDGTRPCPWCGTPMTNPQRATCGAGNCVRLQRNKNSLNAYYVKKAGGQRRFCRRNGCAREIVRSEIQKAWPKYCGPWCRSVAASDARAAKAAAKPPKSPRACLYCAQTLPSEAPAYRKFCDAKCGERYRKGIQIPTGRICGECGKQIPDEAHPQRKYCDLSCKGRAQYKIHAVKLRRRSAEWRERNPGYVTTWQAAYRERHREILRVIHRAEYKADPLPWKNARDRRRALLRDDPRTRSITARDWARLVNRYGHRCAYCGERRDLTLEHVVPLSRGGRHALGNIVPACMPCNASKNSRFVMEWRLGRPAFRRSRKREAQCPERPSIADVPAA